MLKTRKITKTQINQMKQLRKKGLSYSKISLKLQINETSVRYHLNEKFREKVRLANRYEKIKDNPNRKKYQKDYRRNRYKTDSKFREKCKKRSRENARKKKKNISNSKK